MGRSKARKQERRSNREEARAFCIGVIEGFQAEFRRRAAAYFQRWPTARRPCDSCAFSQRTNTWPGQDRTAMHLVAALHEERPFYCHQGFPIVRGEYAMDPATARLCGGWAVICELPRTVLHRIVQDGMRKAFGGTPPPVTDADLDELTRIFVKETH